MTNDQKIEYIKILLERKRVKGQIDENLNPLMQDSAEKHSGLVKVISALGTDLSNLSESVLQVKSEARTDVLKAEQNLKETLDAQIKRLEKEIKEIELLKPIDGKDGKDGLDGKDGQSIKGDKGDKGEDGHTPIKGKDYFDGSDGKDGDNGDGITNAEMNDGDLILTFSNGNKKNVGRVKGASGSGSNGKSVNITYSHDIPLEADGIDGDLWVVY